MSMDKQALNLKKLLGLEKTMEEIAEREAKQRAKLLKELEKQEKNKKALEEKAKKINAEMDRLKRELDPLTNLAKSVDEAKEKALKMLYGKENLQEGKIEKFVEKVKAVYRKDIDKIRDQLDVAKKVDKHGIFNKEVNKKVNRALTQALNFSHAEHEQKFATAFKQFAKKSEYKVEGKRGEIGGVTVGGWPEKGTLKYQGSDKKTMVTFKWYDPGKMNKLLTQGIFSTSWFKASLTVKGEIKKSASHPSYFILHTVGRKGSVFGKYARSTFNPSTLAGYVKPKVVESAASATKSTKSTNSRRASVQLFNLRQATIIHLHHHPELREHVQPLLDNRTASTADFRNRMIRLAYAKKELRAHLVPLIAVFG